jgi:hypothetical protein
VWTRSKKERGQNSRERFECENKRGTLKRQTKIKLSTTGYEMCHKKKNKSEKIRKVVVERQRQMKRLDCQTTHIKRKRLKTKNKIQE